MSHQKFFVEGMTHYSTSKPARLPGRSVRTDRAGPKPESIPADLAVKNRSMGRSNKPGKAPK